MTLLNIVKFRDNLHSDKTKPIDILRCKLSFFGASKYDPKSDLWTRITPISRSTTSTSIAGKECM